MKKNQPTDPNELEATYLKAVRKELLDRIAKATGWDRVVTEDIINAMAENEVVLQAFEFGREVEAKAAIATHEINEALNDVDDVVSVIRQLEDA